MKIQEIGEHLLSDEQFLSRLGKLMRSEKEQPNVQNCGLEVLIEEVRELLHNLIQQQLENELNQMLGDNNRILKEIKDNMTAASIQRPFHEMAEDLPFTEVHRIMDEERKRIIIPEEINDAQLERSMSAFVELKVESIEEKMILVDKRLRSMEDKYETNLKSLWNVLSITESAIFDHLKEVKPKGGCLDTSLAQSEPEQQKKSFFGLFKTGK